MLTLGDADVGDADIGDAGIGHVDIGDADIGTVAIDHAIICLQAVEYLEQAARLSAEKPVVEGRLETSEIYSRFRGVSHRVRGCSAVLLLHYCCTIFLLVLWVNATPEYWVAHIREHALSSTAVRLCPPH